MTRFGLIMLGATSRQKLLLHRSPSSGTLAAALLFASFSLTGCSDSQPTLWPVRGRVEFDNRQPVTSGIIEFTPELGGSTARSRIAGDGTFELVTGGKEGAVSGVHQVVVLQPQAAIAPETHRAHATQELRVAAKHASYQTSGLRQTVAESESNELVVTVEGAAP